MNLVDKAIKIFSPEVAMKRAAARKVADFINTGYSETSGSRKKKNLKGFNGNSKSPAEDINDNVQLLRERSRSLYQGGAPIATSAIKIQKTNVIGTGLVPRPAPDVNKLGISDEEAISWAENTRFEFDLWAKSKHCDISRLNTFYQLQAIMFAGQLLNGDAFCVPTIREVTDYMPYGLRLQLFEADRVRSPRATNAQGTYSQYDISSTTVKYENGNTIFDGVEVDKSGAVIAYHIFNTYPVNLLSNGSTTQRPNEKVQRLEAYGKDTGLPKILHTFIAERAEQYRGIPYLSPVITELKNLSRYEEAEITAALIQSYFTAFIKYSEEKTSIPFNDIIPSEDQVDETDVNTYEMGPGTINVLGENEDVTFGDPSRPSKGFDVFMDTVTKHIGAALEIPLEVLTKHFKSSYSASRAALLDAWKGFTSNRNNFVTDFCQPVYAIWLSEAVARGRINAPGFFNDESIKQAWLKTTWVGPAQGQVDPVKEINASIKKVEHGISTRTAETTALTGGDWAQNMVQLKKENELLADAQAPVEGGERE